MSDVGPRQVVPRPVQWSPGGPAPWGEAAVRPPIGLDLVEAALASAGRTNVPTREEAGLIDPRADHAMLWASSVAPGKRPRPAAVLVGLFERAGDTRVILTRRASNLSAHRGEVSFPGGRGDGDETPLTTALREAFEEVHLIDEGARAIGSLRQTTTYSSGSIITPVVVALSAEPRLIPSPDEVEAVFDVSLASLYDPAIFHSEWWSIPGRPGLDGPESPFPAYFFELEHDIVWGVTARMLTELLTYVAGAT